MGPGNGEFETPAPTELGRSQVFQLRSSRPSAEPEGQELSPVPNSSLQRPAVTRKYTHRKVLRRPTSTSLKENSGHSRRSSIGNSKEPILGRKSTENNFSKEKRRVSQGKSLKRDSIASLASAFSLQPPSPSPSTCSVAASDIYTTKRSLAEIYYDPNLPASKRTNPGANASTLSLPNAHLHTASNPFFSAGPKTPPSLRKSTHMSPASGSPAHRRSSNRPQRVGSRQLPRMPSQPVFGSGIPGSGSSRLISGFTPTSGLGLIDFDRPPSQLSLYEGHHNLGDIAEDFLANLNRFEASPDFNPFADGLYWKESTPPLKINCEIPTKPSSPVGRDSYTLRTSETSVSGSGETGLFHSPVPANVNEITQSMSLTSVEDGVQFHRRDDDTSSWITDSLISPPTMYLRRIPRNSPDSIMATSPVDRDNPTGSFLASDHNQVLSYDLPTKKDVSPAPEHPSHAPIQVGNEIGKPTRTRSGTITLAPPSAGRTRSGTVTQASSSGHALVLPVGDRSAVSRTRSNTIRPAATRKTSSGALVGMQHADTIVLEPPFVETEPILEEIIQVGPVDVDAEFDPNPSEMLVFSSAPDPDADDIDDDFEGQQTILPIHIRSSDVIHPVEPCSDADPLNLGLGPPICLEDSYPDLLTSKAISKKKGNSNRGWTTGATKKGKGKQKQQERTLPASKATRSLKRAFGLVIPTVRNGEDSSSSSSSGRGSPTPSTDPIDFLTGLDDDADQGGSLSQDGTRHGGKEKENVGDKRHAEKHSKKKNISVRWEGMVGSMG